MSMPVPVCRSADVSVGYSTHLYHPIPPPPTPPVPTYAIEIVVPQSWPPGVGLGSVKKTSSVLCGGLALMLAGHDCGKLIPQITIPINNALLPTFLPTSKRKVIVTCFSVRMNGFPAACMSLRPPLPSLSCGQPMSMPLSLTVTNLYLNVFVGVSGADLVGALIATAGTMVIDYLFFKPPGVNLTPGEEWMKAALGTAVGLGASVAQHLIDPRYPVKGEFGFKALGAEWKVGISCLSTDTKNNPSQVSVGAEFTLAEHKGTGSSLKLSESRSYTWDAGGDATKEGDKHTIGVALATPVVGSQASVTEEHHPGAPPAQQDKYSGSGSVTTAVNSGSAQVDYTPGAAEGERWSGRADASENIHKGLHKKSTVYNPDGSTTTTATDSGPDGSVVQTVTTEAKDGSSTMTTVSTDGRGNPVPPGKNTGSTGAWGPLL
ncbi:hypothetical protein [Sorangium sp. So ce131]|uniref:hypothetical protein n=1 Tax=Sorangium sp. So ce131 TaxID=3133282 RepID=UPI003F62768B